MSFQQKVNKEIPRAWPGKLYSSPMAPGVFSVSGKSGSDNLAPGMFVMIDPNTKYIMPCMKYPQASLNTVTVDKPLWGIVYFDKFIKEPGNTSNRYTRGADVSILKRGLVYMQFTVASQTGKFIHLKKSDGTVVLDDSTSKADHIFTFSSIYDGAPANGLCVVSINIC